MLGCAAYNRHLRDHPKCKERKPGRTVSNLGKETARGCPDGGGWLPRLFVGLGSILQIA